MTAFPIQFRSARMVRVVVDSVVAVEDPLAPIVVPLALVSVLELPAAVLGALVPAPGVPVLPMGVVCVLCWPAPVAGSFDVVVGGVLCAMAALAMATVARLASKPLIVVDAVISETP
ncbi:MAG: hypothetical protein NDJ19_09105 [Ramlibacter sp.]|nr:hypothetical protein [Ramlibacter sp.]